MKEPHLKSVYSIPAVENVCNQTLREAVTLPTCSIAHVAVKPYDVSLLHGHRKMAEIYFILDGRGILYHGDKAMSVSTGACLFIEPGTSHKLRNALDDDLEHLVVASPPFDADDVHLIEDPGIEPILDSFEHRAPPIIAPDGATVYEMLSDEEKTAAKTQLAFGYLPPGKTASLHKHNTSEEVYYILSGEGWIHLGDNGEQWRINTGDIIYIPTGIWHGLHNEGTENLEVVCISSPAYTPEDFIPR